MAISGIGIIESGLDGTRPILLPQKYSGKTDIYNLPFVTAGDIVAKKLKTVSSFEERRQNAIIENQLVGVVRAHSPYTDGGIVINQGIFQDKSNHPANELIVTVSGVSAYFSNVFMGALPDEFVWSGLSHSQVNYLWLSIVEEPKTVQGFKSTRQFREVEARSSLGLNLPPNVPEGSVLVGTYLSGIGINENPYGINRFVSVLDHMNDSDNPHTQRLLQDFIVCSGIEVLNNSIWNVNIASGTGEFSYFHLRFLNNAIQYGTLICSGIRGYIYSGNTSGTVFQNMVNLEVDPGDIGYLNINSGLNCSGSVFHNHMYLGSGIQIDGLDPTLMQYLVSDICISGVIYSGAPIHRHFIGTERTYSYLEPKYAGCTLIPIQSLGLGIHKHYEINSDFGLFAPTLRHKGQGAGTVFVRQFVPFGYNRVESIQIKNKIDSGSPASTVNIIDCVGNVLTPRLGGVLTSSGIDFTTISGFAQGGFSQMMPFDLKVTLNNTSGISQYLGTIKTTFLAQRQ